MLHAEDLYIRSTLCRIQMRKANVSLSLFGFFSFADLKKQFEVNPVSTRVEIGQQMELRCVPPAGLPPPRVYWLRGGQPLQTDTAILVSSEGHLLIGQARAQDTGNYTCIAENIAAKRAAPPALIRVYGKYTIQNIPSQTICTSLPTTKKVLNFNRVTITNF